MLENVLSKTHIMVAPDILSVGGPLSEKYDNIGYKTIDCSTTFIVEIQNSIKNIVNIVRDDYTLQKMSKKFFFQRKFALCAHYLMRKVSTFRTLLQKIIYDTRADWCIH